MDNLDNLLDLQKRFEEAKAAQEKSQMRGMTADIAEGFINRPSYASIMLNRPSKIVDLSGMKQAPTESPEDILKMYQAQKEAEKDRANKLEVEQMKEKQRLAERGEDWQRQLQLKGMEYGQQRSMKELERAEKAKEKSPEVIQEGMNKEAAQDLFKKTNQQQIVANTLQSQLDEFSNALISKDQSKALTLGNQMLKTLNSPLGADVVGAEEAKRLGANLQYQLFNLTGPGATFGRDLPAFKDQAQSTLDAINKSIQTTKQQAQNLIKGKDALAEQPSIPSQMSAKDQQALDWAQKNPNDPRAAQIMQKLKSQVAR